MAILQELSAFIEKIEKIPFATQAMSQKYGALLAQMKRDLDEDTLRVAVIGEFSAGKSTFLNAIIGRDLLPHAKTETTAVLTYLHHVPLEDPRLHQVEVCFSDQEIAPFYANFDENPQLLKDILTTESGKYDVAKQIREVHLYCKLIPGKGNLILVDTPGLNGLAQGHRALTMREMQRAHASICLLPIRGLSESNLETLRSLVKQQRELFFVLNFIDQLKSSEGQTVERELALLKAQLQEKLGDAIQIKEDRLFGVSALYALVARDTSIQCLYGGDDSALEDPERALLLERSRMRLLEAVLWRISGEQRIKILAQSVIERLKFLLQQMQEEIEFYQAKAMGRSAEVENELKVQQEAFEKDAARNLKNVMAFVAVECKTLRRLLFERLSGQMEALSRRHCEQLTGAIADENRGGGTVARFEALCRERIQLVNAEKCTIIESCNEAMTVMLEGVYQNAIRQTEALSVRIKVNAQGDLSFQKADLRMDDWELQAKFKEYESDIVACREMVERMRKAHEDKIAALEVINGAVRQKEEQWGRLENDKEQELRRLGERPKSRSVKATGKREVERHSWSPWRLFGSSTYTEEYTFYEQDDSEGQYWDNKKGDIERSYQEKNDELAAQIRQLRRRAQAKASVTEADEDLAFYQEQLRDKEQELQRHKALEKEFREKARREYIQSEKKRFRRQLEEFCRLASVQAQQSIATAIEENEALLREKISRYYQILQQRQKEQTQALFVKTNEPAVSPARLARMRETVEGMLGKFSMGGMEDETKLSEGI